MYNALGEIQKWRCAGCGKHRDEKNLNLDHEHVKITSKRLPDFNGKKSWSATAHFRNGVKIIVDGPTKNEAIEKARGQSLPQSVRGLLCAGRYGLGCNTKLVALMPRLVEKDGRLS